MSKTVFTAVLAGALLVRATSGAEIHVSPSGDIYTIQAGIDTAQNGDVVVVEVGTYVGQGNRDIDFQGKAITVRSTNPQDPDVVALTIIDCESLGRGFIFHSGEGPNSRLLGLTIQNGLVLSDVEPRYYEACWYPNGAYINGGGAILCVPYGTIPSSPTLEHNVLENNEVLQPGACSTNSSMGLGGAVLCWRSKAILKSNTIRGNTVTGCRAGGAITGFGGGVAAVFSAPTIEGNWIEDNRAGYREQAAWQPIWSERDQGSESARLYTFLAVFSAGGGVYIYGGFDGSPASYARLADNNIVQNSVHIYKDGICSDDGCSYSAAGGGVYASVEVSDSCPRTANPTIVRNRIENNTAIVQVAGFPGKSSYYGEGGGFSGSCTSPSVFQDNFISGNLATVRGTIASSDRAVATAGGVEAPGPIAATNNTIANDVASLDVVGGTDNTASAGALSCDGFADLSNCIIWDNSPSSSDFYGGANISYSDVQGGFSGNTNISADPGLGTTDGLHLPANSPCVDAGDPGKQGRGELDIDRQLRVWNGRVDMGADEFGSAAPRKGDMNCDGLVNNQDIDGFILVLFDTPPDYPKYYNMYPNCYHLSADMDGNGQVNNQDIDPFIQCLFHQECP